MPTAVVYAPNKDCVRDCTDALRRVGCDEIIVNRNPDDNSTPTYAIVYIFDPKRAAIHQPHVADDQSPGIRALKRIRESFPTCAVLAVSHATCVAGTHYVEGALLADRCIEIGWGDQRDPALNAVALITSGIKRAEEFHPVVLQLRQDCDVDPNAQPAA